MVAKAIEAMKAKNVSPASACANNGALMLLPPWAVMKSRPTMVAAPKPRNVVMI